MNPFFITFMNAHYTANCTVILLLFLLCPSCGKIFFRAADGGNQAAEGGADVLQDDGVPQPHHQERAH